MNVTLEPARHKIEIPGILRLDMQALTGGDGKTPIILKNSPMEAAGFSSVTVAKSNVYHYTGNGMNWDYSGRSASIREFSLKSE